MGNNLINRRKGDVVANIKCTVNPGDYDLLRAEGRADFDDALRTELDKIEDRAVRAHASEMIRQWRHELFYPGSRRQRTSDGRAEGLREAAETILTAMERAQIDMTILRKFMNGEPVAALTALAKIKEAKDNG